MSKMRVPFLRKKKTEQVFPDKMSTEDRLTQLEKVAAHIERMRLGDYINNMNRTRHIIWINLIGGISKGVGLTIGATLVIAVIFKVLSMLIAMNIPYLTDLLQDVVQIVKTTPGLEKIHHISGLEAVSSEPVVNVTTGQE